MLTKRRVVPLLLVFLLPCQGCYQKSPLEKMADSQANLDYFYERSISDGPYGEKNFMRIKVEGYDDIYYDTSSKVLDCVRSCTLTPLDDKTFRQMKAEMEGETIAYIGPKNNNVILSIMKNKIVWRIVTHTGSDMIGEKGYQVSEEDANKVYDLAVDFVTGKAGGTKATTDDWY